MEDITSAIDLGDGVCIGGVYQPSLVTQPFQNDFKTISNTELSLTQLEACAGGWYLPAAYIIAKEGSKAIQFYKDAATNVAEEKSLGAAVVAAGHSLGTIDD